MNSDEMLNNLAKESIGEVLSRNPTLATQLGNHEYDDQLDDTSLEFLKESIEFLKKTREKLGEIDESDGAIIEQQ